MITSDCPNCGNAVSVFAGSCRHCGAPNRARLGAVAVAGSLLLLIIAAGVAAVAVLRWDQRVVGDDFAGRTTAMEECDTTAAKTPETLHFLVLPMTSSPTDDEAWRAKSLNDIGNAILLNQRDTLDGLMGGSLHI